MARYTILVVDPDREVMNEIASFFDSDVVDFFQCASAEDCLALLKEKEVSLLIASLCLEDMAVTTLLKRAKVVSPETVGMVMTDLRDVSALADGISNGTICHFITKPLKKQSVVSAVGIGLSCYESRCLECGGSILESLDYLRKEREKGKAGDEFHAGLEEISVKLGEGWVRTIKNLTRIVEARDPYYIGHADEVSKMASAIAEEMGLADDELRDISLASYIHDLGMAFVRDEALNKAGPVDEGDLVSIREHPMVAVKLLNMGFNKGRIARIISEHHERVDGKGYPHGRSGDEISIGGRILSVAEFVASTRHNRSYRNAVPEARIIEILREESGKAFDPEVVDAFIKVIEKGKLDIRVERRREEVKKREDTVLVVDDDRNVLRSLGRLLKRCGFVPILEESPENALKAVKEGGVSIIVSDYRMPGMNGVEFLQKAREAAPDVPRILLTAYADKQVAIDAINVGRVYRFLEKPWDDEEMAAVLRSAIVQREAKKRLEIAAFFRGDDEIVLDERAGMLKADLLTTLQALADKNKRIKKLEKARDEFIDVASHELRTPLQVMMNGIMLLQEESDPEVRKRLLHILDVGARRLAKVVGEIFAVAAGETGTIRPKRRRFNIREMLEDVVGEVRALMGKRELDIKLNLPSDLPPFYGDREMLRDAVMNLMTNAVRFTPDGGNIDLTAGFSDGEGYIAVTDDGIGIPPEEQDRIFEKFYVVKKSKHHGAWGMDFMAGSIGLGLTIVRTIAEMHGGRVEVQSPVTNGRGSRFRIVIPKGRRESKS